VRPGASPASPAPRAPAAPRAPVAAAGAGAASLGAVEGESSDGNEAAKNAHMWLSAISWGMLIPAGVVTARSFRTHGLHNAPSMAPGARGPRAAAWFQVHRALQTLGVAGALAGLATGFVASGGWATDETPVQIHRDLGMAVTVLGVLQVTALAWRPAHGGRARAFWTPAHKLLGYAVMIMAIANIYYGIIHVEELGTWAWATYTAVLAVILCVGVAKEAGDALAARRQRAATVEAKLEAQGGGA
jgi:hypothetical protein